MGLLRSMAVENHKVLWRKKWKDCAICYETMNGNPDVYTSKFNSRIMSMQVAGSSGQKLKKTPKCAYCRAEQNEESSNLTNESYLNLAHLVGLSKTRDYSLYSRFFNRYDEDFDEYEEDNDHQYLGRLYRRR
ncbi:hypothetical protein HDV06_003602, partial [Boothiomyces sp. JEL0866]